MKVRLFGPSSSGHHVKLLSKSLVVDFTRDLARLEVLVRSLTYCKIPPEGRLTMPGILDRDSNLTITVHLTSLPTQYSSQSIEPVKFQLACGAGRQVLGWVAAASCARFAHIRYSLALALSFHQRHP